MAGPPGDAEAGVSEEAEGGLPRHQAADGAARRPGHQQRDAPRAALLAPAAAAAASRAAAEIRRQTEK